MKLFESDHYLFHYTEQSPAERDLAQIVREQESCYRYICDVLRVEPDFKLNYFLCETPEEVGRVYGDDDPCNGFAEVPDKIYAVYNDDVKCIGFHEDAHLISYCINRPDNPAVREGLAMFFDRKWWGISNPEWAAYYLKTNRYLPIGKLLDKAFFFSVDCSVSYPIMGAFTEWLILSFGMERYLEFYQAERSAGNAFPLVYRKTPEELDAAFVEYTRLFRTDPAVEKRIEELIQLHA